MRFTRFIVFVLLLNTLLLTFTAHAQSSSSLTRTGTLAIVYGDARDHSAYVLKAALRTDAGDVLALKIDPGLIEAAGGVRALDRQRVVVELVSEPLLSLDGRQQPTAVQNIRLDSTALRLPTPRLEGNVLWLNLMCKFKNANDEPTTKAYIENAFSAAGAPRMPNYWSVTSRSMTLTADTKNWKVLPRTLTEYLNSDDYFLFEIFDDCTQAFDSGVDYTQYAGVNIMLNAPMSLSGDGFAFGGSSTIDLDGLDGFISATWLPPWGYHNLSVTAHEMGHSFGLPHSNNYDKDSNPYDNPWDVMSDTWSGCKTWGQTFGCLGQHTNIYHKDLLGWIPAERKYTVTEDGVHTIKLDKWSAINGSGYFMAQIPIPGSDRFYTAEVRLQTLDPYYEAVLPGSGVNIYEVDTTRMEDAWLVGGTTDEASYTGGGLWLPGETFNKPTEQISIKIDSATANGYQITVTYGELAGDFELYTPAKGTSFTEPNPTFSWEAVPDAVKYKLLVTNNKTQVKYKGKYDGSICDDLTCSVTWLPENWKPKQGISYMWQVKATKADNSRLKSGKRLTPTDFFDTFLLYGFPWNGAVVTPGIIDFDWEDDLRLDEYRFVLSSVPTTGQTTPVYDTGWMTRETLTCIEDICTLPYDFSASNGQFMWQVKGKRTDVKGKAKTPKLYFEVGAAR